MPVIPGSQESQILNPSSPVPIDSPSEKRLTGESFEQFGKGMTYLGETLQTAAEQANKEKQKLQLYGAVNQFQFEALQKRAEQAAAAPITGDKTGFGAVENYAKSLQPNMQNIAAKIDDPSVREQFLVQAGQHINDDAVKIWAEEVKKRVDNNKVIYDNAVNTAGQIVMQDPTKLDGELSKLETTVLENHDIPDAVKNDLIHTGKRGLILSAIEGRIDDNVQQYDTAHKLLDTYGDAFSPEEKAKEVDKIQNAKWNRINRDAKIASAQRAQVSFDAKDGQRAMTRFMGAQLKAGIPQEFLDKQDDLAVKAGLITPQQRDAIRNPPKFTPQQDMTFTTQVVKKALETGDFQSAANDAIDNVGKNISLQAGTALEEGLKKLQAKIAQEPTYHAKVKAAEGAIDNFKDPSLYVGMSRSEIKQAQDQVETARGMLYTQIAKDPNSDPGEAAAKAAQGALQYTYKNPTIRATEDPAKLHAMAENYVKEAKLQALNNGGTLTDSQTQDYAAKLREIKRRQYELSLQGQRGK